MTHFWDRVKGHRLGSTWFLVYWLIAYSVHAIPRWNRANNAADMMPSALLLHLLLPAIAGGTVACWGNSLRGRIQGGMFAGGAVLAIDFLLLQVPEVVDNWLRNWPRGHAAEGVLELSVFLIAMAGFGGILGLAGASCTIAVTRSLYGPDPIDSNPALRPQSRPMRPRLLLIAGVLVSMAAITTVLGVIPSVLTDTFAQATPQEAATGLRVCAYIDAAIGLVMFASAKYRGSAVAMAVAGVGGLLAVLLGSLMSEGGGAFCGHGAQMHGAAAFLLICAVANLAAGVLALVAVFRPARVAPRA